MSEKTLEQKAIEAMVSEGFAPDQMTEHKRNFFIHGFMCGYIRKSEEVRDTLIEEASK